MYSWLPNWSVISFSIQIAWNYSVFTLGFKNFESKKWPGFHDIIMTVVFGLWLLYLFWFICVITSTEQWRLGFILLVGWLVYHQGCSAAFTPKSISQVVLINLICNMFSEITHWKLLTHLPGANELNITLPKQDGTEMLSLTTSQSNLLCHAWHPRVKLPGISQ